MHRHEISRPWVRLVRGWIEVDGHIYVFDGVGAEILNIWVKVRPVRRATHLRTIRDGTARFAEIVTAITSAIEHHSESAR